MFQTWFYLNYSAVFSKLTVVTLMPEYAGLIFISILIFSAGLAVSCGCEPRNPKNRKFIIFVIFRARLARFASEVGSIEQLVCRRGRDARAKPGTADLFNNSGLNHKLSKPVDQFCLFVRLLSFSNYNSKTIFMQIKLSNRIKTSRYFGWIMLVMLVLIWGTSFILIKRGLEVYSSIEVGAIRIFVSFVVLLPFALKWIRKTPSQKLKYIFIIGVIGTGIPAFLFAAAQTHIDSSLAGILNSLTPLFTMLVGFLFFGQKLRWLNVSGVFMGLLGAVGLIYATNNGALELNFYYSALVVVATMLYALQSNMIKYYLNEINPVSIASIGFFFIGVPAGILLFFFTDFTDKLVYNENGLSAFLYVAILGVFASAIAITVYNKLVQTTNAVFASSVTYFVPVLALIWGVFDGEKFPFFAFVFSGVILTGVFLVNKKGRKPV